MKDWAATIFRRHAPEALQKLRGTTQQVQDAVAEHERRVKRLSGLLAEARGVVAELAVQIGATEQAVRDLDAQAPKSADPEAIRDKLRGCQEDLTALHAQHDEQQEQAGQWEMELTKAEATLVSLRSQRELLNARMKAVAARQRIEGTAPARGSRLRWERRRLLAVAGIAVMVLGAFSLWLWGTTHSSPRAETQVSPNAAGDLDATLPQAGADASGASGCVDVLSHVNVARDQVVGEWRKDSAGVSLARSPRSFTACTLMLPVVVNGEYDLAMSFTRLSGDDCVCTILPVGSHVCMLSLSPFGGQCSGLELIDDEDAGHNSTTIRPGTLTNGKKYGLLIKVRLGEHVASVDVLLDKASIIQWRGKYSSLGIKQFWRLPQPRRIGLGAMQPTTFHSVQLKMTSGTCEMAATSADRSPRAMDLPQLPVAPQTADAAATPAIAPFDAAHARELQLAWAKRLGVPIEVTNSIGMKLVLIPPGEFLMGSPKELIEQVVKDFDDSRDADIGWSFVPVRPYDKSMAVDDKSRVVDVAWFRKNLLGEGPQHRVRITRPFYLGATVVTQEEYQRVMGANPSAFSPTAKSAVKGKVSGKRTERFPVERVSWGDAVEFCRRLTALPGENAGRWRYALPTEAQWEYACRAGNLGPRYFSVQPQPAAEEVEEKVKYEHCWFKANAGGRTHAVGGKRPNAWGLYDFCGNVWEWCQDWYDEGYYARSPLDDPRGPPGGSYRVRRGIAFDGLSKYSRSAFRNCEDPGTKWVGMGFRVVIAPSDVATTSRAKGR